MAGFLRKTSVLIPLALSGLVIIACGYAVRPPSSHPPTSSIVPASTSSPSIQTAIPTSNAESTTAAQGQKLSTPGLIEQAFANGEITAEQRLLYLAYAVYEYKSLPVPFQSNTPWRGTFIVKEINEAVASPQKICAFSATVQRELRRLRPDAVACGHSFATSFR